MIPPIVAVSIFALVLGGSTAWYVQGLRLTAEKNAFITFKNEADRLTNAAVAEAHAKEAMWQGVVNGTEKNYRAKVAGVQSRLVLALDELRQRPERPAGVPDDPRADCAGANGAELGGSHAEFLARLAALAARQDAGLEACYTNYDAIRGQ